MREDNWPFLNNSAEVVAPRLLGCHLERDINGHKLIGKIVETEAYDQTDAASHSFKGSTARTEVMFGPPGHLYVYFTYGMHFCCNVVCGPAGEGAAVLIRALEPLEGEDVMANNRNNAVGLTNGPAKLCQALNINKSLNGHNLQQSPLRLLIKPALNSTDIIQASRIGISQAKDKAWRFYIAGNSFVSKPAAVLG